jgi:hypothetical protein
MGHGVLDTALRAAGVIVASTRSSNAELLCRGLADFASAIRSQRMPLNLEGVIGGDLRCYWGDIL